MVTPSNAFARLCRTVASRGLAGIGRPAGFVAARAVDARVRRAAAAEVLPLERRLMMSTGDLDGTVVYTHHWYGAGANRYDCPTAAFVETPTRCACQANAEDTVDGSASTAFPGLVSMLGGVMYDAGGAIVSGPVAGDGGTANDFGTDTVASGVARVTAMAGEGNVLALVSGPTAVRFFTQGTPGGGPAGSTVYTEGYGSNATLAVDQGNTRYTLTDSDGTVTTFYGPYAADTTDGNDQEVGKPVQIVSPGGLLTTNFTYNGNGQLGTVTRTYGAVTETFTYSYFQDPNDSNNPDNGLIASVALTRQTTPHSGPTTTDAVQTALYTYYPAQQSGQPTQYGGSPGDLQSATIVDGAADSGRTLGTSYYRYTSVTLGYTTGTSPNTGLYANGSAQDVLELAYGPASFARLAADLWSQPPSTPEMTANVLAVLDGETDAQVTAAQSPDTADAYATIPGYPGYTSGQVSSRTIQGAGCSSCSGGLGTTTYQFVTNPNAPRVASENAWATETIVGVPYTEDANHNPIYAFEYIYYNGFGQPMLDVQQVVTTPSNGGATTSRYEGTYTYYDADGEAVFVASPSAVTLPAPAAGPDPWSELDANADLLANTGTIGGGPLSGVEPTFVYVAAHAGLVTFTSYGSVAGVAGEVETATYSAEGDQDTAPLEKEAWTYQADAAQSGGPAIPLATTDTTYGGFGQTDARQTTYAYPSFFANSFLPKEETVTAPAVAVPENGVGGTNATRKTDTVYDAVGRPVWQMDAGGFITYTAYDDATGAVVKQIANVNLADTADFTGSDPTATTAAAPPPTWSTPSGSDQELVTTDVVDDQGRTTEAVSPAGNLTYTVYNDTDATASNPSPGGVRDEVRVYPGWVQQSNGTWTDTGPTQVTREVWPVAGGAGTPAFDETLTTNAVPDTATATVNNVAVTCPTGTESVAGNGTTADDIQSLTRDVDNSAGQVVEEDAYFSLAGATYTLAAAQLTGSVASDDSSVGNYHKTTYSYEFHGWQDKVTDPAGTISRTIYDTAGEVTSKWVGTYDKPTSGYWSPANDLGPSNMEDVEDDVYDQRAVPLTIPQSLTEVSAGSSGPGNAADTTYYVEVTYAFGNGTTSPPAVTAESAASAEWHETVHRGDLLQVAPPAAVPGAIGYDVYVSTTPGDEQLQGTSGPTPFTQSWVQPADGSIASPGVRPASGSAGNGDLTGTTTHATPGNWAGDRTTLDLYDWQDQLVATKFGVSGPMGGVGVDDLTLETDGVHRPVTYTVIDNAGEAVGSYGYDGDGLPLSDFLIDALAVTPVAQPADQTVGQASHDAARLRTASAASYDVDGEVYRSVTYPVNQATGGYPALTGAANPSSGLTTNTFYDTRGDVVEIARPGGLVEKSQYDGNSWVTQTSSSDGGQLYDLTSHAAATFLNPAFAGSDADDVVLRQTLETYDKDGNVVLTEDRERYDNDPSAAYSTTSATLPGAAFGDLVDSTSGTLASRDSFDLSFYDAADRQTADADLGTNGGVTYQYLPPVAVPTSGALVTQTIYGPNGSVQYTIDPMGRVTADAYDLTGRVVATVANCSTNVSTTTDFTLATALTLTRSSDGNQTTTETFDGNGDVLTMTAYESGGAPNQTTAYVYGVSPATGSAIYDNDLLAQTQYPDPATGVAQTGVGWTFGYAPGAGGSGVSGAGTAFTSGTGNSPEGRQVGFVQQAGMISQAVDLNAGAYTLTFAAAQRTNNGPSSEQVEVEVDGVVKGTVTPSYSSNFTAYTVAFTTATPGPHTVAFVGVDPNAVDETVFVDNVQLHNAVAGGFAPEVGDFGFESPSAGTGYGAYIYSPPTGMTSEDDTFAYDAAGGTTGYTDEKGTVHAYRFDALGRETADVITTAAPGVDTSVLALGFTFDTAGRPFQQTSYNSSTSLTAAHVVNQVEDLYNDLGQLTEQYQALAGAVAPATTPGVGYTFVDLANGANDSRLRSTTYPNGRIEDVTYAAAQGVITSLRHTGTTVTATVSSTAGLYPGEQVTIDAGLGAGQSPAYFGTFAIASVNTSNSTFTYTTSASQNGQITAANYPTIDYTATGASLDNAISRPDGLADHNGATPGLAVESDVFLGLDTIVSRTQGDGDRLAYNLGMAADGSNRYTGFDTFGRVTDQNWVNAATGVSVNRLQYGHDADGNVLYRNDTTSSASLAFGEAYTTDGLNRLTGFSRGTLSPSPTPTPTVTNPSASKTWALDALGNWTSTTTNGNAASPRTNNAANQVTADGSASMTYDADGNALTDGSGTTYTFDAWNRIATASGTTTGSSGSSGGSGSPTPYTVTYGYTAGDEQATRQLTVGGTAGPTELRYYDAAGRVVEDDHVTTMPPNSSGGSATVTTTVDDQYVWGLGYVNDLIERDGVGGRLYAMQDANYNVTAVANASGGVVERFAYDPYGARTVLTGTYAATTDGYGWQVGFQGGIADATTGLIRFGARDYSPTLGRWDEQDPAGYVDGDSLYQASRSDPVGRRDPSGFASVDPRSDVFADPNLRITAPPNRVVAGGLNTKFSIGNGQTAKVILTFGLQQNGKDGKVIANRDNLIGLRVDAASSDCCHWIQFITIDGAETNHPKTNAQTTGLVGHPIIIPFGQPVLDDGGTHKRFYSPAFSTSNSSNSDTIYDQPYFEHPMDWYSFKADDYLVCGGAVRFHIHWEKLYDHRPGHKQLDGSYSGITSDFATDLGPYEKAEWFEGYEQDGTTPITTPRNLKF